MNRKGTKSLFDFIPIHRPSNDIAVIEQSLYRTRKYTYREIREGAYRIAASLHQKGFHPGDRLILWGENSARWMMTFYACVLQQIVVVPIDASFSEQFVSRIQSITGAGLICSDRDSDSWKQLLISEPIDEKLLLREAESSTLLEIIYTSGSTGDPKGVMITHGNILSNLVPVYDEIQKYKKYSAPFSPIGFAHLIPLSHLFGQIMGLFIPQMLNGFLIFTDPAPARVVRAVKQSRASAVICVPQELSLISKYVSQRYGTVPRETLSKGITGFLIRCWNHRKIHQEFGWKFLAFIAGGATLPVSEEDFWKSRGFFVIQGYGLTETAPSVTISHPFKGLRRGSVGKTLPGVEVKIAEDGEVLVRGPNVSPGYFQNESATREAFQDGWLRTGDLGRFDEEGHLELLGRKKEVIVTAEGLNIHPQDVENVILKDKRVRDCAAVAQEENGKPVVHVVLVLAEAGFADQAAEIISNANSVLERFQRISSFSIWPEKELPRTSTGKLKRLAIASAIKGEAVIEYRPGNLAERVVSGAVDAEVRLEEDLGLSSLDRVELMVDLERSGIVVDETSFSEARTVGDIVKLSKEPPSESANPYPYWNWPQWLLLRWVRFVALYTLVFPALRTRVKVNVLGLENLSQSKPPFLFVSNHQGFLDAPVILKALPFALRHKIAPAMGTDRTKLEQYAAAFFFNSYPLPGTSIGLRQALEHTGQLVDRGYSPLVFPEGKMTLDGKMQPFRPGIGVIAQQVKVPVVPILLRGVFEIWPTTARGPGKGTAEVRFGAPLDLSSKQPAEITALLETRYRDWY